MTKRYPGGYITKTPPTVSTTSAPGIWTMEQQAAYQKAGTWPFGGPFNYIEDVFSTWLYTGTGASQTHTNNIDLAGKGGLVWLKRRNGVENHYLQDSSSSFANSLSSNTTAASIVGSGVVTSVSSTGFTTSSVSSGTTYASWTFRKQPKFFDVVTYTGTGSARTIAHNLGSVPGCIIVKRTNGVSNWAVYHRSVGNAKYLNLNNTNPENGWDYWNYTDPTSTVFSLGANSDVNGNGSTYVAYIFAHNAGGFGLTGTDNVISCGSYTGNGSTNGPTVTLGYEPQWLMIKRTDSTGDWPMFDNMRGIPVTGNTQRLDANGTQDEATISTSYAGVSATGFYLRTSNANFNASGGTYIYIAIRRGPMKTPTTGTSVFQPVARTGTGSTATVSTSLSYVDLAIPSARTGTVYEMFFDRLRGATKFVFSSGTNAEITDANTLTSFALQNGVTLGSDAGGYGINVSGTTAINWLFKRAPGFFDVVCYTGTGVARTVNHNLGVAPEFMIVKSRTYAGSVWGAYHTGSFVAGQPPQNCVIQINSTGATYQSAGYWNNTAPTASVFSVSNGAYVNNLNDTYVAYLFATCPGVSKVGSYTGTGATQTISCGFAARFVLIKRTDSTGDWFVWDTARGMVAGTDPRLALNSTAAETNANWVYTDASGFQIVTTDATVNASGGSYIYLAIS